MSLNLLVKSLVTYVGCLQSFSPLKPEFLTINLKLAFRFFFIQLTIDGCIEPTNSPPFLLLLPTLHRVKHVTQVKTLRFYRSLMCQEPK